MKANSNGARAKVFLACLILCAVLLLCFYKYIDLQKRALATSAEQLEPSAGNHSQNLSPGTDIIWFVESAFHQSLDGRQACAIESAAHHNPNVQVHLLTTGDLLASDDYVRLFSTIPNFKTTRLDLSAVFKSTPLESWYESERFQKSRNHVEDLSDALRYLTLWRHGGIYLDLDVVVLRSLRGLRNAVVLESERVPANGILFFDKGHGFLSAALKTCAQVYSPGAWGSCGPSLLRRLSQNPSLKDMVTFLRTDSFLAVHYDNWKWFFDPNFAGKVFAALRESYGAHVWNKLSKDADMGVGSGSAYDVLARFNCPRVYQVMKSKLRKPSAKALLA